MLIYIKLKKLLQLEKKTVLILCPVTEEALVGSASVLYKVSTGAMLTYVITKCEHILLN